jgi:hypothetical protein
MKRKMKEPKSKQKTTPDKGTRKEKRKDRSPYKRLHLAREQEKKNERIQVQTKDHTWQANKKRKRQGPKLKQKITLGKGTRKEKRKHRS